jgi:hypothetical protein
METVSKVVVTRRGRKRRATDGGPTATLSVTVTTSGGRSSWMHELEARSPAELRQLVNRDLDELVGQVWGGV